MVGREDAKNSSVYNPNPTYLSTLKIYRVELCTELFYVIIPTLFLCFLLICYPYILLHFNVCFFFVLVITSGNRTPGSRFYSDLLDTLADSVCIHQLVLKRRSSG